MFDKQTSTVSKTLECEEVWEGKKRRRCNRTQECLYTGKSGRSICSSRLIMPDFAVVGRVGHPAALHVL